MRNFHSFSSWRCYASVLILLFLMPQINFSQNWVKKVEGHSMWSIAKDYAGNIFAGTSGTPRGIFKSTDGGETWTNIYSTGLSNYLEIACDSLNNVYAANVSNGLIFSTDGGQSFTTIPASTFGGNNVNTVACGRNGHIFVGVTNGGVWRSTDFGATFTNTGAFAYTIVSIAIDKFNANRIYAGASSTSLNGFFISTDGGQSFGSSTLSLNIWQILQNSSNELFVATTTSPYPFSKSTDGGLTWTTVGNQPAAMRGATLDLTDNIYTAGNGGVYKSTNGGATFVNHNLTFSSNKILTFNYKIMVCVSGTTNGGVWIYADSALIPVELISFSAVVKNKTVELNWITATEVNNKGFEILRSAQNEDDWQNIGFVPGFGTTTEFRTYSFTDYDLKSETYNYRLKQIDFNGAYQYSEIIEVEVNQPFLFALEQNYPNPFNPSTRIEFRIADFGFVTLKVFDVLGNEVETLVNEYKPAGSYEVQFDASNLSSGVYFYKLFTDNFIQTRKMILCK